MRVYVLNGFRSRDFVSVEFRNAIFTVRTLDFVDQWSEMETFTVALLRSSVRHAFDCLTAGIRRNLYSTYKTKNLVNSCCFLQIMSDFSVSRTQSFVPVFTASWW